MRSVRGRETVTQNFLGSPNTDADGLRDPAMTTSESQP
jgi:hypothetical protein